MAAEGVELLEGLDRLAVMGFAEVVRHLPFFRRLLYRAGRALEERAPDLVVPIDYPGFNLRLASAASARGVPVLYYIAPQVWAWKRRRTRLLARVAAHVAVILPFEEGYLRAAGVRATFVGHPLLGERPEPPLREPFLESLGVPPGREIIAVLPGSRRQELDRHLRPFLAAAEQAAGARAIPVLARAPGVPAELYAGCGAPVTDDAWALLSHARAALVKSGTGTLQAAVTGTPMVVAYRTSRLTFALARRIVRVPHVALVNLVAGRAVVPELLQGEASPENLAVALAPLLPDGPARTRMGEGLAEVRAALAPPHGTDPSERVAALAADLMDDRGAP